jgi:predicted nucleotidyltransferase
LNSRAVEYLVIGGVAAIAHGVPRLTLDLDILIRATPDNVRSLLQAFEDAGLGTAALTTVDEILANEVVIFKDRIRVDVQTRTPGIDFEGARGRCVTIEVEGVPVYLLSIDDLIASKRAAAREKDLQDVEALERLRP